MFLEGIALSFWALQASANLVKVSSPSESRQSSKARVLMVLALSLALGAFLFVLLPDLLAGLLLNDSGGALRSVAEGSFRVVVLLSYGVLIGRFRPIQVGFAYHAAEHMVAHAAERGLPIALESVRAMPRTLPWCGTTMILVAVAVATAVFPAIDLLPRHWSVVMRFASVPAIFALSVELLLLARGHRGSALVRPVLQISDWFQKLTTRPPSDEQIEVAMRAFTSTLEADRQRFAHG